jgi:predicted ATPase/DNA-binding CsgD family transcriptional regulator
MVENAFLGRRRELEHLAGLLERRRLVTLTGPPGVGKTRLATEVAAANAEDTYFVELAVARDRAALVEALAAAVRAPQSGSRAPLEAVMSRLRQRRTLLVLDNCEHLTEACAGLVDALLEGIPTVRILITSRQPLELPAETVVDVRPLALGDAVALFVDRAALRGSTVDAVGFRAVEQICERLDGLPLAIELAAGRAGFMTPQEIAARVDDRFRLLTSTHRSPAHHASLQAALKWSYDLLSPAETTLFRRLAVFSGGWTMEAAQAIGAPETDPDDIVDSLSRLAAHSLVVCTSDAATTRYRYLETVRNFAETKLRESGEEDAIRNAHAKWYRHFAERAGSALAGREQPVWLNRVEAEYPNLRSSLEWCLTAAPAVALALAGSLSMFWLLRGRLTEGRDWLVQTLAANADDPGEPRGQAHWGVSVLAARLGAFDEAWMAGSEALTLARDAGDVPATARALYAVGFVNLFRDLAAARSLLEASIDAAEQVGDQWCLANALAQLGFAEIFQGDATAALALFERSLAACRECGDQPGLRSGLLGFGYASLLLGAYGVAETSLQDGLSIARRLDDPFWIAVALVYTCELARARGEHDDAERNGEESIAVAAGTDSPLLLGFSLSFAGRAALDAGRLVEARSRFEQALGLPSQAGNAGNVAIALLGLSEVTWVAGDESGAAQLLKEALATAEESGDRLVLAGALLGAAHRARSHGDAAAAEQLAHSALDHGASINHPPSVSTALEVLAGLAIEDGRFEYAARLCGAAARLRREVGCRSSVSQRGAGDLDLARLRATLTAEELDAAWNQGERLSPEEVCGYAQRGRGPRRRPASGLASLSPAEREVMHLASLGLTNAEIGEHLFISARTVQTHMAHIFAKLGVTSRRQLVQAAAGQTPGRPA